MKLTPEKPLLAIKEKGLKELIAAFITRLTRETGFECQSSSGGCHSAASTGASN
jgi:hypothetical protein